MSIVKETLRAAAQLPVDSPFLEIVSRHLEREQRDYNQRPNRTLAFPYTEGRSIVRQGTKQDGQTAVYDMARLEYWRGA